MHVLTSLNSLEYALWKITEIYGFEMVSVIQGGGHMHSLILYVFNCKFMTVGLKV